MAGQGAREQLQISVTGRHMPVTEPLERYAVAKLGHLERYLGRLTEIKVVLSSEKSRRATLRNVAEARAVVRGRVIRAQVADADMYAAIDALVDKLHLQLTRLKERTRTHKHGADAAAEKPEPLQEGEGVGEEAVDDEEAGREGIVRIKQFAMKPMFSDEAIDAMEELGHAFYVFLNAETEQVNVLYRRRDGAFGLIEPALE